MDTKICSKCHLEKPLIEFPPEKRNRDGKRGYCKKCYNLARKKRRLLCIDKERAQNRIRSRAYRLTPRGRYNFLKNRNRREVLFSIDEFVDWYNSQPLVCHYCGQLLTMNKDKKEWQTITIDRKDNNLPYTLSNIALCCHRCNEVKSRWLTEKQMLEVAQRYF